MSCLINIAVWNLIFKEICGIGWHFKMNAMTSSKFVSVRVSMGASWHAWVHLQQTDSFIYYYYQWLYYIYKFWEIKRNYQELAFSWYAYQQALSIIRRSIWFVFSHTEFCKKPEWLFTNLGRIYVSFHHLVNDLCTTQPKLASKALQGLMFLSWSSFSPIFYELW